MTVRPAYLARHEQRVCDLVATVPPQVAVPHVGLTSYRTTIIATLVTAPVT